MKSAVVVYLLLLLPFFILQPLWKEAQDWSPSDAVGVWGSDQRQIEAMNAKAEDGIVLGPWPFAYDGETVTVLLVPLRLWAERSPDDYYRLKARWVGRDLYWLPPRGGEGSKVAWCFGQLI